MKIKSPRKRIVTTEIVNGEEFTHRWTEPAVGECDDCSNEVYLDGFTNTCEFCGAEYNSAGQRLAPRSQWGEETGEHPADLGRIR